jgi:hypothetical protein
VGTVALRVSFVNKNRPALQDDVNGAIAEAFFEKFYSEIFNTDEDFRCLYYQTRVARLFLVQRTKTEIYSKLPTIGRPSKIYPQWDLGLKIYHLATLFSTHFNRNP